MERWFQGPSMRHRAHWRAQLFLIGRTRKNSEEPEAVHPASFPEEAHDAGTRPARRMTTPPREPRPGPGGIPRSETRPPAGRCRVQAWRPARTFRVPGTHRVVSMVSGDVSRYAASAATKMGRTRRPEPPRTKTQPWLRRTTGPWSANSSSGLYSRFYAKRNRGLRRVPRQREKALTRAARQQDRKDILHLAGVDSLPNGFAPPWGTHLSRDFHFGSPGPQQYTPTPHSRAGFDQNPLSEGGPVPADGFFRPSHKNEN